MNRYEAGCGEYRVMAALAGIGDDLPLTCPVQARVASAANSGGARHLRRTEGLAERGGGVIYAETRKPSAAPPKPGLVEASGSTTIRHPAQCLFFVILSCDPLATDSPCRAVAQQASLCMYRFGLTRMSVYIVASQRRCSVVGPTGVFSWCWHLRRAPSAAAPQG
jgi:hypothetical protein